MADAIVWDDAPAPSTGAIVWDKPAVAAHDDITWDDAPAAAAPNFANVKAGVGSPALPQVSAFGQPINPQEQAQANDVLVGAAHGLERGVLRGERGLLQASAGIPELFPFLPDSVKQSIQDVPFGLSQKVGELEKTIPAAQNLRQQTGEAVGGFGAGALTLGAGEAGSAGQDVLNAGGSLGQAEGAAAMAGAGSEAGLAVGKLGGSVPTRMLSQGAASGAAGEVERRADNAILPDAMHRDFNLTDLAFNVGAGVAGGVFPHAESGSHEAVRLAAEVAKTKAAETAPETVAAAAAGDPVAQGAKIAGDAIAEAKVTARAAAPVAPLPPTDLATPSPEVTTSAPAPVTAEPFANGKRVLFRGDVDAIKAQLADAGLPEGMVKQENGQPVGVYYPDSYADPAAKALGVARAEPAPEPVAATPEPTAPGFAQSVEPILNGSKVLFRGDVDAMRQRLTDAGLDPGYAQVEDGAKVGIYFPAAVADKVASVLKAHGDAQRPADPNIAQPTSDEPRVQTDTAPSSKAQPANQANRIPDEASAVSEAGARPEQTQVPFHSERAPGNDPRELSLDDLTPDERASLDRQTTSRDALANNASGESAASLEAINRIRDARDLGQTRAIIERDGSVTPLTGVSAVDTTARSGQIIVQRNVGKNEWTVLSHGDDVPQGVLEGRINRAGQGLHDVASDNLYSKSETLPDDAPKTDAPMYHGTRGSFDNFDAAHSRPGGLIWASDSPEMASKVAGTGEGAQVRPVHLDVKNPFDPNNPKDATALAGEIRQAVAKGELEPRFENALRTPSWALYEHPDIVPLIKRMGYDGLLSNEGGHRNVAAFDASQVRHALYGKSKAPAGHSYGRVPDSLMGFRRSGPNKPYHETNYRHVQPVRVTFDDGDSFVEAMNGLNKSHALERARRNWDGANIEPISDDEFARTYKGVSPYYSKSAGEATSSDTNKAAEDTLAKTITRGGVSKLKRNGVQFLTKAEVAEQGIGGHKSVSELDGVKGITTADRKTMVVVTDNNTPEGLAGTAAHEVFHGHAEEFIGTPAMKGLLDAVGRLSKGADADLTAAAQKVPKGTPAKHVNEETAAYLLEDAPNNPLSTKITDAVKLQLNRLGIPLDWIKGNAAAVRKIGALTLHDLATNDRTRTTHLAGNGAQAVLYSKRDEPAADAPDEANPHPLAEKARAVADDLLLKVAPMATGTHETRAVAKDFANDMRQARWEGVHADKTLTKQFNHEQLVNMWQAADRESVAQQSGIHNASDGLASLAPNERAAVEQLQARANQAFDAAKKLGMVEGEGLPSYVPRMVVDMGANGVHAFGRGEPGDSAGVLQNIRTLPMATAKLEEAIAGRTLINAIKDIGDRTGSETVRDGSAPSRRPESSGGSVRTTTGNLKQRKYLTTAETEAAANAKQTQAQPEHGWFTIDHPAFKTWRPRFDTDPATGKTSIVKDGQGNPVFDQVPIYVRDDFKGPLDAVLSHKDGAAYSGLMALKAKTMGVIMYSPIIHNAVEWGRALPAMPGKVATFRVYFDGNKAKNDPATMREAIQGGLIPSGGHGGTQDLTSIQEGVNLTPGQSWTAKLLSAVPGLFDKRAGDAVKRAVDAAGNVWHNVLLWDRIADLQMGLYVGIRDHAIKKGMDQATAVKYAAHEANRFAGTLPQEAMSTAARKTANLMLFSRSFTLGNLGVMKDAMLGLPKDVQSQILRDSGKVMLATANSSARRKAWSAIVLDTAFMYIGNSILQSSIAMMSGASTPEQEKDGYLRRLQAELQKVKENPASLLHPLDSINALTPQGENEPGKQDRILVGHSADGTAIYMRNPTGKIGEEFMGWEASPLDKIKSKLSTFAKPAYETIANDQGYGRKVYDPYDNTASSVIHNAGRIAALFIGAQVPLQGIQAAKDYLAGVGSPTLEKAQVLGPFAGITFSKGAPGGEAVGQLYAAKDEQQYRVNEALPDIRKQIQKGDVSGAVAAMTRLGIPPGLQKYYVRTTENPGARLSKRALQDFTLYGSPDDKAAMARFRNQAEQPESYETGE